MTRVLNLLGAALPTELKTAGSDNVPGFWEGRRIVDHHASLLASLGSAWDDTAALPGDWLERESTTAHEDALLELLFEDFADSPLFAVKDPRISRLAPLWLRLLDRFDTEPSFVLMLRRPDEVASSLAARNGFGREKSLLLWLVHLVEAEQSSRGLPRAFVSYEQLLDEPQAVVDAVGERLAIRWPSPPQTREDDIRTFLSHAQRHHVADRAPEPGATKLHDWVAEAYALAYRVAHGEIPADDLSVLVGFDELAAHVRTTQLVLPVAAEAQSPSELRTELAARNEEILRLREALERSERRRRALRARLDAMQRTHTWRFARRLSAALRLAYRLVAAPSRRNSGSGRAIAPDARNTDASPRQAGSPAGAEPTPATPRAVRRDERRLKVAMTMVVRDAADVLAVSLRHHLADGVEAVYVIDHGSTDGTSRLLARFEADGLPLAWERREGPFDQQAMATDLATQAAADGADWILTVDGDELWQVDGGFKAFLAQHEGVDAVSLPVVNFVQWRHARTGTPAGLLTLCARPTQPLRKSVYDAIHPGTAPPWVVRLPSRKSIARAGVLLGRGAHAPLDPAAVVRRSSGGACLHAPLRASVVVEQKSRRARILGDRPAEDVWRDNSWLVPIRVGPAHAPAPLTLDLRIARIALRHLRQARRDFAAAALAR